MITVRRVEANDPDALALWKAQVRDTAERYGDSDFTGETDFPTLISSFVGYTSDGTPIACIVVRWSPFAQTLPGDAELKRLWVAPEFRGHGYARVMLGAAEQAARAAGATRLILESGTKQPEALALYETTGWDPIAPYGDYRNEPESRCYAKDLPTRVLVLNGTMAAGKTTVAEAIHEVLHDRGARCAFIDADHLCQAKPTSASDPFNQALMFENLTAVASNYRARGYGLVVAARIVEDPDDRARWEQAFVADRRPAEVTIVRLDAPEEVRLARIMEREPEGHWREWGSARTVELAAVLEALELDDAVVENDGSRDRCDVAVDVLDAAGW